jgi:hypothetical protein
MTADATGRVGRRSVLAAGLGGVAAAMAGLLGRAGPVAGADGESVKISHVNDGTTTTVVHTSGPEGFKGQADLADGLVGQSAGANKSGVLGFNSDPGGFGVYGLNSTSGNWGSLGRPMEGIKGYSKDLVGVLGQSAAAEGIRGQSNSSDGAVGQSNAANKSGVYGYNTKKEGYGVYGANHPAKTHGYLGGEKIGVYGVADDVVGCGVQGVNMAANGYGVQGFNAASGTWGSLGGWAGVYASASKPDSFALNVDGRVQFHRSGIATIPAGKSSVAVGTAGGVALALFPESRVLATLQTNRAGLYVQAAVPSVVKNTITIHLNKKAPAATTVAWFVLS